LTGLDRLCQKQAHHARRQKHDGEESVSEDKLLNPGGIHRACRGMSTALEATGCYRATSPGPRVQMACYILQLFKETGFGLPLSILMKTASNPIQPANIRRCKCLQKFDPSESVRPMSGVTCARFYSNGWGRPLLTAPPSPNLGVRYRDVGLVRPACCTG